MKFSCPVCGKILMATTAAAVICCNVFAFHIMDDEPIHSYPQEIVARPVVISTSSNIPWGTGSRSG